MAPPTLDKTIQCRDCSSNFTFSIAEQAFYKDKSLVDPVRCTSCRASKKASIPKPKKLKCSDCLKKFDFSGAAQKHYKENNWDDPSRCPPCREKVKSLAPLNIECNMCKKEFVFSVKAQKSYSANHWKYPVRCRPCHEEYKKTPTESKAEDSASVATTVDATPLETTDADAKAVETVEKTE